MHQQCPALLVLRNLPTLYRHYHSLPAFEHDLAIAALTSAETHPIQDLHARKLVRP